MKKFLSILAAAFLIIALLPLSAAAHGHGDGNSGNGAHNNYALCNFENCDAQTAHRHGKTWYGGHTADDGHSHHTVCTVSGCKKTAIHNHNGVSCYPKSTGEQYTLASTHTRYRSIDRHH